MIATQERTIQNRKKQIDTNTEIKLKRQLFTKFFDEKLYHQDRKDQIKSLAGIYIIGDKKYRVTENFIREELIVNKEKFEQLSWKQRKEIRFYINYAHEERAKDGEETTVINMGNSLGIQDRRGSYLLSQDLIEDLLPKKETMKPAYYHQNGTSNGNGSSNGRIRNTSIEDKETKDNPKTKQSLEELTELTSEQKSGVKERLSEIYKLIAPYKPSEEEFVNRAIGEKYQFSNKEEIGYSIRKNDISKLAKEYYQKRNPISFFGRIKRFVFG